MDENVGMDHYRRERSRRLLHIAKEKEVVPALEQAEAQPSLPRVKSSPNLPASDASAPKVPQLGVSQSFSMPRLQTVYKQSESNAPSLCSSDESFRAFLRQYANDLNFLVPQRLAYAALTKDKLEKLKSASINLDVSVISSYLHRRYVPLCADFGPVTINVVHRFCQVKFNMIFSTVFYATSKCNHIKMMTHSNSQAMEKRISKAERANSLVIYCVEPDSASIANASFLLAAFLLLVVGKTVQEAVEPFIGVLAPCALAPFRDASFRPQVPCASPRSSRSQLFLLDTSKYTGC